MKKKCSRLGLKGIVGMALMGLVLFFSIRTMKACQEPAAGQTKSDSAKDLVKLHVSVSDKNGNFISTLNYFDFEVSCDKTQQQVSFFSKQDEPIGIVFLLDMSGSMSTNSLSNRFISAIPHFIELGNKLNEFSVVTFNQQARLSLGWTTDRRQIEKILLNLVNTQPIGQTSIFDAMELAIGQAKGSRFSKRAVVLLSDGNDSTSKVRYDKIKEELLESKTLFYTVNAIMKPFPRDISDIQGVQSLVDLALLSGGASFLPTSQESLIESVEQIANELRHQYTIGFKPNCAHLPNKPHKVRVKLARKSGATDVAGASINNRGSYQMVLGKQ